MAQARKKSNKSSKSCWIVASLLVALALCSQAFAAPVSYTYDSLNRVISVDYGNGNTLEYTYDAAGNMLTRVVTSNVPPTADPNGPYSGTEGLAVTLNGSGSTDPNGNIVLYEWDVDNDGTYDYSSSSQTQSHTYTQQGTYTIKLRVTDNLGAIGEALTTADISDSTSTLPDYSLTVAINGSGTVSSLLGINCPTDCSEQYTSGNNVTLTASPQTGYQLEGWAGCDSPSGNQCIINMNADKTVTVSFIGQPTAVTISGRQMLVNGEIFTIKGVGYSPVPIGVDPETFTPYGDYFTSDFSSIYNRDLPLLREMGANTIRLWGWNNSSDHTDFLDKAYNAGNDPLYVIVTFWMGETLYPDITSSPEREQIKSDFRAMVAAHKNNPAVIMWSIGNELNADWLYGGSLDDLFSLVNEMAQEAHAEEGSNFHPVTTALLDKNLISTISTYNSSVTSLDIWGVNVYRGNTFESLFSDYETVSGKPLVILEYGIDAYDDANGDEYKNIGSAYQAEYAETLWNEISDNSDICIGGTIMAYSDEWWKGKYSTDSLCTDNDPAYHGTCGYTSGSHPDGYSNEEWWGIMRTVDNGTDPDVMEPREVYSRLQTVWSGVDVFLGDVNGDGTMDIVDALFIARYLIGLPVSNFNPDVADVNCDGSINIVDALFIARYLIGLPVPGWCGP